MRASVLRALPIIASVVFLPATAEESSFTKNLPDSERAFVNATNLSADKFFSAYMSNNVADRRYAEIYFLGVLDATEGVSWCSYRRFKTATIDEVVFEGLKKLTDAQKQQRASSAIISILTQKFSCKGADK